MPLFTFFKCRPETLVAEIFYPLVLPAGLWPLFVNAASILGQMWAGQREREQKRTFLFLHFAAPHFIKSEDFLHRTFVKVGMRVDGNISAAFLTLDTELLLSTFRFFHATSLSDKCRSCRRTDRSLWEHCFHSREQFHSHHSRNSSSEESEQPAAVN